MVTKALVRLMQPVFRAEFNQAILDTAIKFSPDMLIAFKGAMVERETLRTLRAQGLPLYQYYPDNSIFAHAQVDPGTMEEYDCCFLTKKFLARDAAIKLKLRDAVYLPHGYDPEVHSKPTLSGNDKRIYGAEIAVVMVHTAGKERFLDQLLRLSPQLPIRIWGPSWKERCKSERVKVKAEGMPLLGQAYAKALYASKINLALLSEEATGSTNPDLTSTRTFEIPACGGFMLHRRTPDVLELYQEGSEIECFDSPEEALGKIEFYLQNPAKREEIARKGYQRAVPAYSYDERVRFIVDYHVRNQATAARAADQG